MESRRIEAFAESYRVLRSARWNTARFAPPQDLLAEALDSGWYEVAFTLYQSMLVAARNNGRDFDDALESLLEVAYQSDDPVLLSKGLTCQINHGGYQLSDEMVDRLLARAVALLDSHRGNDLLRPGAYISCGLGFQRLEVWRLWDEMNVKAIEATKVPVPEGGESLMVAARRIALNNRVPALLGLYSHEYSLDNQDIMIKWKREIDDTIERFQLHDGLREHPVRWVSYHQIAALAGEPRQELDVGHLDEYSPDERLNLEWIQLALESMYLLREGKHTRSAETAKQVLVAIDTFTATTRRARPPAIYHLILKLAAQRPRWTATDHRYAEHLLTRLHIQTERVAAAAVGRQRAETVLRNAESVDNLAYRDSLTSVANRRGYEHYVKRLGDDTETMIGVVVIDLDHLKTINDAYGHKAGDLAIAAAAKLIAASVRPDDLVARIGGDEFVVILYGAKPETAGERADDLMTRASQTKPFGLDPEADFSLSAGSATGYANQLDELLTLADLQMFQNKQAKRGTPERQDPQIRQTGADANRQGAGGAADTI